MLCTLYTYSTVTLSFRLNYTYDDEYSQCGLCIVRLYFVTNKQERHKWTKKAEQKWTKCQRRNKSPLYCVRLIFGAHTVSVGVTKITVRICSTCRCCCFFLPKSCVIPTFASKSLFQLLYKIFFFKITFFSAHTCTNTRALRIHIT